MRSRLQSNTSQQGFTLIELVVVIVILGILAVTAAPRFIDLTDDAKTATLEGVAGAVESTKSLIFAKALIAGNQTVEPDAAANPAVLPQVTVPTGDVNIRLGYPRSNDASVSEWEDDLLELNDADFTITSVSDVIYITPTPDRADLALVPTSCFVSYTEATSTTLPVINVSDCP
jgi:MSHA pilin protein MshA